MMLASFLRLTRMVLSGGQKREQIKNKGKERKRKGKRRKETEMNPE